MEPDRTMTPIGAVGDHPYQPGTRWPLDGGNVSGRVLDTGRPVTVDPYGEMTGTIAAAAHSAGIHAGVGAPIIVEGRVWGTVSAAGTERVPLPPNIEHRLTAFTELVATSVSNAQARQEVRRLLDEQAALRRIATLVAQGAESQVCSTRCARRPAAVRRRHRESRPLHARRDQPHDLRLEPAWSHGRRARDSRLTATRSTPSSSARARPVRQL